jgi:hypothetical protein
MFLPASANVASSRGEIAMSIEAMYPSRSQSRSQNPLFARAFRRQRLAFMVILALIGFGLLLLQLFPMTAHADGAAGHAIAAAVQPVKAETANGKPVRMIQIYAIPAR